MSPTPWDKSTHYTIKPSETGPSVDGYKPGEPKKLVCDGCGASVLLTEEPSAGVDDLEHSKDCENRYAKSDYWRNQFLNQKR